MKKLWKRRSDSLDVRETLHALNQRYKDAWDRAERLQDELDNIKSSRAYRVFAWWRRLASRWLRQSPSTAQGREAPSFTSEYLKRSTAAAAGSVSVIIPFKNHLGLLKNCLRGLRRGSRRPNEIVLIDNGSTCPRMLAYLARIRGLPGTKVIECPGPFNFARLCNEGTRAATGDFLLFLNNDVEVLARHWLRCLLELAARPDVGVVGATLLYPDETLQHVGIYPLDEVRWGHLYRGLPHDHPGHDGELLHARTVPAVTGACLMIGRALFARLSGFDEAYGVTFNDVDLCLRVRRQGLKVAICPRARLWHLESVNRGYSRENDDASMRMLNILTA